MENERKKGLQVSEGLLSKKQVSIIKEIQSKMNGLTYIESKEISQEINKKLGYMAVVSIDEDAD